MDMRKLSSNILGTGLVAVAFSVLAVGTVWAGSAAYNKVTESQTGSSTTLPSEEDTSDSTIPENDSGTDPHDSVTIKDLYDMVTDLSEQVETLESVREDQALTISELEKTVKKLSTQLQTTNDNVQTLSDSIVALEPKLSKLNAEGIYTGSITPSQMTRKFTTDEIYGDWPLERTKGQLATSALKMEFGSCYPDSRNNAFLTVDVWRSITCTRIPK